MGVLSDVIIRSGAWYSYEDQKLGQGRENSKRVLEQNPELTFEIDQKFVRH